MSQKIKALIAIASFWGIVNLSLPLRAETVSEIENNEQASLSTKVSQLLAQQNSTITDIAASDSSFDILALALSAAGLTETLSGQGPFTVFAPTDKAFSALGQDTLLQLLQPANRERLAQILTYHVIPGKVTSKDILSSAVQTVEGSNVQVSLNQTNKEVRINDAKVTKADIMATNGVIHVIDKVLLPSSMSQQNRPSQPNPQNQQNRPSQPNPQNQQNRPSQSNPQNPQNQQNRPSQSNPQNRQNQQNSPSQSNPQNQQNQQNSPSQPNPQNQ